MAVNGSIIYTLIGIFMLSLGSSFYSLINQSDTNTPLPKEYCLIQSLYSTQTIAEDVLNGNSGLTTFLILLNIALPFLAFLIDLWHSDTLKCSTAWTHWTFWTAAYVQHSAWLWPHILGQTISFGTTEILRYFFLTPNDAFWQQCSNAVLNSSDITAASVVLQTTETLTSTPLPTTTTSSTLPTTTTMSTLGCQNNASLPLIVSLLCLNTTLPDVNALQPLEHQLLYFLLQNLHSMPNLCLVSFGSATFIFIKVFVEHPLKSITPTGWLFFVWLIYTGCFFLMSMYFYDVGQSSFLDIIISFVYGLFLQSMLYFILQKHSTWSTTMETAAAEPSQQQQELEEIQLSSNPLPSVHFDESKNISYESNKT